VVKLKGCSTYC